jgi:hypothetical protein
MTKSLNPDEFKLFDDSPYIGEHVPPESYVDQQGFTRSTTNPKMSVRPHPDQVRARERWNRFGLRTQPDTPPVEGGTRTVTHSSRYENPPHTHIDRFAPFPTGNDRERFNSSVVFAADETDTERMRKGLGGARHVPYMHTYEVPDEVVSIERFGDDDHVHTFDSSDTPQLWESVNATRQDAVENERVVRFTNSVEDRGSQSYILPKSLINSGKIKYVGTVRSSS